VRLRPDPAVAEQEIMAFRKHHLAAYKYPREIGFLNTLPVGPTGKILKKEPHS
jgi:long-chain acyl-CoA synthetase